MKILRLLKFAPIATIALGLSGCEKDGDECTTICTSEQVLSADCKCVDLVVEQKEDEVKAGLLVADETWTADRIYTLQGKVVVDAGVTLTIEPGTIIKGAKGTGSLASALIVARGGKLMAQGTAEKPIIMTSIEDNIALGETEGTNLDETFNSLWGGLIILGNAPISAKSGAEAQIEGIPADDAYGAYGGTDANDNSGVITYLSLRHGGALIGDGNEINGITLGGVGNGTTIEYVEVVGNLDDGIEFFGGSVNLSYGLVWAQGDDAFDIDQSYSGTIDGCIYIAGADSDHGLEIDGPESSENPDGSFTFQNSSLKGLNAEYADWRSDAQGSLLNNFFFNFAEGADIELDNDGVSANFAAGKIIISGNEFALPAGVTDLATLFADKSENGDHSLFTAEAAKNSAVTTRTVGADPANFEWTFAASKGALEGF